MPKSLAETPHEKPAKALSGKPAKALGGKPAKALGGKPAKALGGKPAKALGGKPAKALADIPLGKAVTIKAVEGPRVFRRRLLEMGLIPGVEVRVVTIAPLGDPLRIEVRGGQWSIRRNEAAQIEVELP